MDHFVEFTYSARHSVDLSLIERELEAGACFALYADREEVVAEPALTSRLVKAAPIDGGFRLCVADEFLPRDVCFTRIMTSLLFNFLDFGPLRLEHVNVSQSELSSALDSASTYLPEFSFGTVVKPYFLMSQRQRIEFVCMMADHGFDLVKEDECHIVALDEVLTVAHAVKASVPPAFTYIPNVSGFIHDVHAMATLHDAGIRTVMVNGLVVGLQVIANAIHRFPGLSIWVHRVGYKAIEGVLSVQAFTQLAVLAGARMIHIGTPVSTAEIDERRRFTPAAFRDRGRYRPVFTKLTPETLASTAEAFGADGIYMVCGWIRDPGDGAIRSERIADWITRGNRLRRHDG